MVPCSFRQLQLVLAQGINAYHKQEIVRLQHMLETKQAETLAIQIRIDAQTKHKSNHSLRRTGSRRESLAPRACSAPILMFSRSRSLTRTPGHIASPSERYEGY